MGSCSNNNRNYIDELLDIINEIVRREPEPEMCNIRCPPLGCPRGPCPGACSYQGVPDPCCISKMPCCAAPPPLPCRVPPLCFLQSFAKEVGYPPDSCLSPPNARLRLLLSCPARRNVSVTCPPPPCCPSPPNCITPCCPSPPNCMTPCCLY